MEKKRQKSKLDHRWYQMIERAKELAEINRETGELTNRSRIIETLIQEFECTEAAARNAAGVGATQKRKTMGIVMRGKNRNVTPVWTGGRPRKDGENMANDIQDTPNFWDDSNGLLTIAEVAKLLNVSRETVRNWASEGTLPVINLGKESGAGRSSIPRFKRSAIRQFLDERSR